MDKQLIRQIKEGDSKAFKELYYSLFNAVLFYAKQYLGDEEEARDIAQDTFVSLWNHRAEIDENQSVKSYIFTIARNRCLNLLRTRMYEKGYQSKLQQQSTELNYRVLSDSSAERVLCKEVEQLLSKTLKSLPESYSSVFEMNRNKGMTYVQISQALNLSPKTVEYRMMHVLQVLRKRFKDYIISIFIF